MKITWLGNENLKYFRPFLLPEAVKMIEDDEFLTAFGLIDNGIACGAMAGYWEGMVFNIISIYVAPDYRNKGGATLLLGTLCREIRKIENTAVISISYVEYVQDHSILNKFLDKFGFKEQFESNGIYVTKLGELWSKSIFEKDFKSNYVKSLKEVSDRALWRLKQEISDEDFGKFTFESDIIDRDLSMIHIDQQGNIDAFLLIDRSFNNELTIRYIFNKSKNNGIVIYMLIKYAINKAKELCQSDSKLYVQGVTSEGRTLLLGLLGGEGMKKVSHTAELIVEKE